LAVILTVAFAAPATAQMGGDPTITALKGQFGMIQDYVTKSSDKGGEDLYAFQPTPEVRTYGKLLAHIADGNYLFCSAVKGEKSPVEMMSIEKTKTTKADIQKALADSYAYCDGAFGALTPAKAGEAVDFFGMQQTRLSMLSLGVSHNFEHYGNLVTYMRMKKIVPPSTEQQQQRQQQPAQPKTGE
jgi:uncharacterized damage-inducible protein DinB